MSIALKGHSGQRGVGDELGKSGTVKLSELNTSHARSRIYGTGGGEYPYKRVNSNEIAAGHAPAPDGDTSGATGTANSLAEWEGYEQFNDEDDRGSNMDISALDDDSVTFTWDRPGGYTSFAANGAMSDVKQEFYVKECADQTETEAHAQNGCEDDNPFAGTRYSDGNDSTSAGTGQILDDETWYIGSVRMSWNDKDNGGSWYHVGGSTSPYRGYLAVASPAGSNTERDSVFHDAIIFKTDVAVVCTTTTVGLSTTSGNDGACDSCDNWNINSRTTVKINHTGFAQNKILYTTSGTCVNELSASYKWASRTGERAYTLDAGQLGSTANSVDCQDVNICEEFGE